MTPSTKTQVIEYSSGKYNLGEFRTTPQQNPPSLFLTSFEVYNEKNGHGTLLFREVMKIFIKSGCQGGLKLTAAKSSHLFWIKMGLAPNPKEDKETIMENYLLSEILLLRRLKKVIPYIRLSLESGAELDKSVQEDTEYIQYELWNKSENGCTLEEITLQMILEKESFLRKCSVNKILNFLKPEYYPEESAITEQQFSDEEKFIHEIVDNPERKVSMLQNFVIPCLLHWFKAIIEEYNNGFRFFVDSTELGEVEMFLTDAGMKRWKEAIEKNIPFTPFQKLEHLQPVLTDKQWSYLQDLFSKM